MRYEEYLKLSKATLGETKADVVFKNGKIIDVFTGEIIESSVAIKDGIIIGVSRSYQGKKEIDLQGKYIAPGYIDAHLHLESTMVTPNELVCACAKQGTTTFIADPHEAANVSGGDGIDYILDSTEDVPANVFVMMPSCVPSTSIDDNGCTFTAAHMTPYLKNPRILGLGEVMDAPSVLNGDASMHAKLDLFRHATIDGHAPGLTNKELSLYRMAGIQTDHEGTTFEYALEEVRRGMHVHIREGSAARNLEDIVKGIVESGIDTDFFSFCTDDKHIEDILREGHISWNVKKAISLGLDPIKAIKIATINTARLYGLRNLGAIAPGYQADFVILDDLKSANVTSVYYKGKNIQNYGIKIPPCPPKLKQTMHKKSVTAKDFCLPIQDEYTHVIGMVPGQIVTEDVTVRIDPTDNFVPQHGLLKIAAVERHKNSGKIGVAIAMGYGLKHGAIASSVSHDSHNIIVIGDNDEDMAIAVNEIIRSQGGYTVVENGKVFGTLSLPIMGLMSDIGYHNVQETLEKLITKAHEMNVPTNMDPFITLSFMALPVIPNLRITPRGLYHISGQGFTKID